MTQTDLDSLTPGQAVIVRKSGKLYIRRINTWQQFRLDRAAFYGPVKQSLNPSNVDRAPEHDITLTTITPKETPMTPRSLNVRFSASGGWDTTYAIDISDLADVLALASPTDLKLALQGAVARLEKINTRPTFDVEEAFKDAIRALDKHSDL